MSKILSPVRIKVLSDGHVTAREKEIAKYMYFYGLTVASSKQITAKRSKTLDDNIFEIVFEKKELDDFNRPFIRVSKAVLEFRATQNADSAVSQLDLL